MIKTMACNGLLFCFSVLVMQYIFFLLRVTRAVILLAMTWHTNEIIQVF
jgi:hypothetical protein